MIKNKKGQYIIPVFPRINVEDLKECDVLLIYGNNPLTKWHGKKRRKQYGRVTKVPTHATMINSITKNNVWLLDTGLFTDKTNLNKYLSKKKVRIDIIRYYLTPGQIAIVLDEAAKMERKRKLYDWRGFVAFASQMRGFQWLKKIVKPSEQNPFCSDGIVMFIQNAAGYKISRYSNNYTSPTDLLLYVAQYHPESGSIYTLNK